MDESTYGERLGVAIKQSGKTKQQVAIDSRIALRSLYHYLNNERLPSIEIAFNLSRVTDRVITAFDCWNKTY